VTSIWPWNQSSDFTDVTMAIYPTINSSVQSHSPSTGHINIEAWTEQATQSLQAVSISSPPQARGTSDSLAIPLDEHTTTHHQQSEAGPHSTTTPASYRARHEPFRRDSLKRREALLKGKEGSRRRQRWENGSYPPHHTWRVLACRWGQCN